MTLQFIRDNQGNTTGVYIPIEDWQDLKRKYQDLQKEEVQAAEELADWQKQVLDQRLSDYYNNPDHISDFDQTIDDLEKRL